jgi:hypothetical protein
LRRWVEESKPGLLLYLNDARNGLGSRRDGH